MSDKYKLVDREVVPVTDLMEWARGFEDIESRRVASDHVGDVHISTVFLGLDNSFGSGPPLLFETMVLGGPLDGEQERYSTYAEAEAGHRAMLERVRPEASLPQEPRDGSAQCDHCRQWTPLPDSTCMHCDGPLETLGAALCGAQYNEFGRGCPLVHGHAGKHKCELFGEWSGPWPTRLDVTRRSKA